VNRFYFFVFLMGLSGARAADLADAIQQTREDIQASVQQLNQLRDQVEAERAPLTEALTDLEKEAAALRQEMTEFRSTQLDTESEMSNLRRDVEQLRKELDFIETVSLEYRRGLEVRVHPAEIPGLTSAMKAVEAEPMIRDQVAAWVQWGLDGLEKRFGGFRVTGSALDAEGNQVDGVFLIFGSSVYFVSNDGGPTGWVRTEVSHLLPGVIPFEDAQDVQRAVALAAEGAEPVLMPVDVTGGEALRIQESTISRMERLKQGGVMVIPLLAVAGLSVVMALLKCVDLMRFKVSLSPADLSSVAEEDSTGISALGWPIRSLVEAARRHRRAPREHLEEILHEQVLSVLPRLERSLGMLAVFGGVAPLLGLLGTVTGMIHTFQLVELFGTGDSRTLSGGISEALVTTALGLMIAIPVLIVHAMLARWAKSKLAELEQTAVSLVNTMVPQAPGR
jgi:biopolymer transport protein ExbB